MLFRSRWANVRLELTAEEDLWVNYFTTSRLVEKLIKKYGKESFEYEVRKEFDTTDQAREWETKVLQRMRVIDSPDTWLNRTDNKAILNEVHPRGALGIKRHHSEETRKKMSASAKKRGPNSYGKKTEATKKNISEGLKKLPPIECPHCGLSSISRANMSRYHFDNCSKYQPETSANQEQPSA